MHRQKPAPHAIHGTRPAGFPFQGWSARTSLQPSSVKLPNANTVDSLMMRVTRPLSAPQRSASSDTLLDLGNAAASAAHSTSNLRLKEGRSRLMAHPPGRGADRVPRDRRGKAGRHLHDLRRRPRQVCFAGRERRLQ